MQPNPPIHPDMRARIPLYAAGLGAGAMGLAALNAVLSGGEFTLFAFALMTIGYGISWGVRAGVISHSTLATIALIIFLSTMSAILIEPQFRYQLIPSEALEAPDLLAAIVLASLMVAYSFKLGTDMSVLFLCVPSLSLIGLLASIDPTARMLTYFALYLALTSFALIRQNALAGKAGSLPKGSVKLHAGMTAGVTAAALVFGSLIGTLLYPVIAKVFTSQISNLDTAQLVEPAGEEFVPIATGPIALSDQEVMTVKCSRGLLWRERTFNRYTGQGWTSSLLPQEQKWIHPTAKRGESELCTFKIPLHLPAIRRSAVERVEQTFHITSGVFRTVYAAPEPETVTFEIWQPLLRLASGLEAGRRYRRGTTYHVVSDVSAATPRQLRTASDVYPEIIRARYLGTPQSCWQIEKLSRRLTEGTTNPFEKAQAISGYLSAHYAYDTNAPAAPLSKDAVSYFLFETRRGYCDMFASAMVIMCRQAGIPARWATGFAPGEFDPSDRAYHVRVRDRHAWAELYFPEYGWVPFDVAPSQQARNLLAGLRMSWRMLASDRASLFAGGLIILLAAYLVKAEVADRIRRNAGRPGWQHTTALSEAGGYYQRMCRILARRGLTRHPAMTPLEYALRTGQLIRLREITDAVDSLTADFVEFRYSERQPTPERIEAMKSALLSLTRGLKIAKREKLLARR